MSYTTCDFEESMKGQNIQGADVEKVLAAWGNVDKDGACCDECGGEWTGGFLLQMKDGRFAYVSGWCDYTGWGCQDGTSITYFDEQPPLEGLDTPPVASWDIEPADLNAEILKVVSE
jgi:hypothetical protein